MGNLPTSVVYVFSPSLNPGTLELQTRFPAPLPSPCQVTQMWERQSFWTIYLFGAFMSRLSQAEANGPGGFGITA